MITKGHRVEGIISYLFGVIGNFQFLIVVVATGLVDFVQNATQRSLRVGASSIRIVCHNKVYTDYSESIQGKGT